MMETGDFWQGERVQLRAIEPEDADIFFIWNRDSERGRFLDFLWPPTSLTAVRAWAAEQAVKKFENDSFFWVIENLEGNPVGSIDTHHCDPKNGTFSYGIAVAAEHRHKGYAAEAVRLVLRYYFDELRYQKAYVFVNSDNPASLALHDRLGFEREGRQRRMIFTQGAYVDRIWFGMTVEDFRASLSPTKE